MNILIYSNKKFTFLFNSFINHLIAKLKNYFIIIIIKIDYFKLVFPINFTDFQFYINIFFYRPNSGHKIPDSKIVRYTNKNILIWKPKCQ